MLGNLVVRLGLDAADFTSGMSKSEADAKRLGEIIDRAIAVGVVKAESAIRALGAAARVTGEVLQSLTTGAGQFKDLEETTGAAAESLASFAVSAATAGVEVAEIGGAMNRLTKSLVGVDDESKAAGAALAAIGINVKQFKELDPAAQYEAVGKALAKFADGGAKVAVVTAAFGKAGAEQLKVFAALEEAGGRQTILTQRQIDLSDAFGDSQAKSAAQLRLYAQAAASEMIPAFADLTAVAVQLAKEFLGVDEATGQLAANNGAKAFAEAAADSLAFLIDAADGVARTFQVLGRIIGGIGAVTKAQFAGDFAIARQIAKEAEADIGAILDRTTVQQRLLDQRAASASGDAQRRTEDRGFVPQTRPRINFSGAVRAAGRGGAAERTSEAERYLESLQRQLQGTRDLSAAEKVLEDLQTGRLKLSGKVTESALLGVAQQIDSAKRQKDQLEAEEQQFKDFLELRKRATEEAKRGAEALGLNNQALAEEIGVIVGGESARRAIEDARVSSAIAIAEETKAKRLAAGATLEEVAALDLQLERLRERGILLDQRNVATDAAAQLEQQQRDAQRYVDAVKDPFTEQFRAVLDGTKSAKEAVKDFATSWAQAVNDIAARNLADAIFGTVGGRGQAGSSGLIGSFLGSAGGGSNGGWLNALLGAASSYFGGSTTAGGYASVAGISGGRAMGGPVSPRSLYEVGERGPEVYDDGTRQFLLTGRRGGRVIPNHQIGGGRHQTNNINIRVDGATTRKTATQIGAEVARSLAVSSARGN